MKCHALVLFAGVFLVACQDAQASIGDAQSTDALLFKGTIIVFSWNYNSSMEKLLCC